MRRVSSAAGLRGVSILNNRVPVYIVLDLCYDTCDVVGREPLPKDGAASAGRVGCDDGAAVLWKSNPGERRKIPRLH